MTSKTLCINGSDVIIRSDDRRSLLDFLRDDLRLTGAKRGCDIGACGSCTVILDGKAVRSCHISLHDLPANSATITTIEGLSSGKTLHPIQQAFIDHGAIQCGFCTPGMVLSAKALLDRNASPTRDEICRAISLNLCRCTGYQQIIEAIEDAAQRLQTSAKQSARPASDSPLAANAPSPSARCRDARSRKKDSKQH